MWINDGFNRRRRCISEIVDERASRGEGNYFFPFCRLFLRSLAPKELLTSGQSAVQRIAYF